VVAYGADTGNGFARQPFVDPSGPNPTDLLFHDDFDTSVAAAFGQLEFNLSDTMEVALAARYDREEREVSNQVPNVLSSGLNGNAAGQPINPAFLVNPNGIPDRSETFTQFQPKVTWSWNALQDVNVYASWGVGFRSGGFNSIGSEALLGLWYGAQCPGFLPTCAENGGPGVAVDAGLDVNDEYDKEVSTSFELGSKAEFWNKRLRLNAAIFQTEVEDNQFFEFFAGPFGLLRAVTTIDEVEIRGLEADFNAALTENFSLFGGIGLLDSEIKENKHRPLSEGNDAPQAPDTTYNLGAQFEAGLTDSMKLVARLDWQHVGDMWFHTLQGEATPTIWQVFFGPGFSQDFSKAKRDAYDTLNARISLQGENWGVTAWGRNISDEEYLEEVIPAPEFGGSFIHPAARDSYGIDVSYQF
jgi:iron complex outermembrane receptor protein